MGYTSVRYNIPISKMVKALRKKYTINIDMKYESEQTLLELPKLIIKLHPHNGIIIEFDTMSIGHIYKFMNDLEIPISAYGIVTSHLGFSYRLFRESEQGESLLHKSYII